MRARSYAAWPLRRRSHRNRSTDGRVPSSAAAVAFLLVALPACGEPEPSTPSVGTNSNWLTACTGDDECSSQTSCQCGACTVGCENAAACGDFSEARCATDGDPALRSLCSSDSPGATAGLCLPSCTPGSCARAQACVGGACVLAVLPDVPFCDRVVDRERRDRRREDEVLELLQGLRTNGGARCGNAPASSPVAPLRLDARLLCSARVRALDLEATRDPSPVDSVGRDTQDRFAAAGYAARMWGESFAVDADHATRALELMLEDVDSCARLVDAALGDVGVGSAGGTTVIAIGSD